jgi:hypothetical protein
VADAFRPFPVFRQGLIFLRGGGAGVRSISSNTFRNMISPSVMTDQQAFKVENAIGLLKQNTVTTGLFRDVGEYF